MASSSISIKLILVNYPGPAIEREFDGDTEVIFYFILIIHRYRILKKKHYQCIGLQVRFIISDFAKIT